MFRNGALLLVLAAPLAGAFSPAKYAVNSRGVYLYHSSIGYLLSGSRESF
jgi:hypothetical protein